MALIDTSSINRLAVSLRQTADALRAIRDGTGAIALTDVVKVQSGLRVSKTMADSVLASITVNPQRTIEVVSANGGPDTVQNFQTQFTAIDTAAHAWGTALESAMSAVPEDMRVKVQPVTSSGVTTRMIVQPTFIPSAQSDTLRAGAPLAGLITALESSGA